MTATAPADSAHSFTFRTRIESLDQFRGYAVIGMLVVNFLGSFWACPEILRHHHTYCSYADTIMPQFLFAVGFGFRLAMVRSNVEGRRKARLRVARRIGGLILLSLVLYTGPAAAETWEQLTQKEWMALLGSHLKRTWFQTLMHIAVTSLWVLPVIGARQRVRVAWLLLSAGLHTGLSLWFNFQWTQSSPAAIDGGPLGFLTWTISLLFGSFACDWVVTQERKMGLRSLVIWSLLLIAIGWGLSCGTRFHDLVTDVESPSSILDELGRWLAEPPFVPPPMSRAAKQWKLTQESDRTVLDWLLKPAGKPPGDDSQSVRRWNYWMMCQRSGTLSYLTFATGLSGIVFALFYALDKSHSKVGVEQDSLKGSFSRFILTFGRNALVAYVIHLLVEAAVKPFVPRDAPGWYLLVMLLIYLAVIWLFLRSLEKQAVYIRI